MICKICGQAIHAHDAEPPARIVVQQAGRRRDLDVCGRCVEAKFGWRSGDVTVTRPGLEGVGPVPVETKG